MAYCALALGAVACGTDSDSDSLIRADSGAGGGGGGGTAESAGAAQPDGGTKATGGNAGLSNAGQAGAPPPAVEGRSVYALECHGDSKACSQATVPCFGVSGEAPNVAAGWACANRCVTSTDCSSAPSGAQARASCVPFSAASHCLLVCQNETQSFGCPDGMMCYLPPKSALGFCLWP